MCCTKRKDAMTQIDLTTLLRIDPGLTVLTALLNTNPDLTVYEIKSGDRETKAEISVADLKETLLAINGSSRRIHFLYEDLQHAEARINDLEKRVESLERGLRAIANYHF
jgi:hypothetical protein